MVAPLPLRRSKEVTESSDPKKLAGPFQGLKTDTEVMPKWLPKWVQHGAMTAYNIDWRHSGHGLCAKG